MGDLVLTTRVAVAKRNLLRVCELETTLSDRASNLRTFLLLPGELQAKLADIQEDRLPDLERRARALRRYDPELLKELRELTGALDDIESAVDGIRQAAASIGDELRQFARLRSDVGDLAGRASITKRDLTGQTYLGKRDEIEKFFREYVDLLRGIALRSAGFTEQDGQLGDIFLIADMLPRLWGRVDGWEWGSLAVPSYSELNHTSEAMMLRLGFPEWTIWALPFVQNEFGHVYVAKGRLADSSDGSVHDATLLADALATVVTGPAYACAALLLRLDPAAVTKASSPVALRSATTIVTLTQIAAAVADASLIALTERLRDEWRDAVVTAGGNVGAFDAAMVATVVTDAALCARQTDINRGRADRRPPVWAAQWATVNIWADALRKDPIAPIDVGTIDTGESPDALALLMDAAWLARVGVTGAADAPESRWDAIAKAVIQKMLRITQDLSDQSPPGAQYVRPNP
jgi:hypothetical protein